MKRSLVAIAVACAAALAVVGQASAHAHVSPPLVVSNDGQEFGLLVPTEKEDAQTTTVELTVPEGFSIDSFVPSPGWKRSVQAQGSGEEAVIQKVTWSGGSVPTGEDAAFHFLGTASSSKTYEFAVRQTYSDGSIVDWSGPESSDTPAPTLEAKSSFGGSPSTLAIVALALAGVALLVAVVGLAVGAGKRTLA
jgi:uncharacterized protein YcnI